MPNYNFREDLPIAQRTELEVAGLLNEFYGYEAIHIREDNWYDLLVEKDSKRLKIEIKEDFTCKRTGNVGLEYECRGKPSGISVTKADVYIYKVHTLRGVEYRVIKTETLRKMIDDELFSRVVCGGDPNSRSMNYLFTLDVFQEYSKQLFV